ncbi:excalibur calcium-binding domain-containing protein [Nocardia yunnanensis]|uniref:excalibur calcium-binding domain-containing protein n=1 Tax=Nocardia yunnanensis TaxID=2382165 RepID=UPI001FEA81C3|nr:excalibur calcium-binding domain-containing protein [Nocardia yunnanensis]
MTTIAAQTAVAYADVPTGSSGTGSSALDTGSAAIGSAGLTQTGSAGGPVYENCDQARAAGVAPLFRGQPGYSAHLDPDGTGMACPTV